MHEPDYTDYSLNQLHECYRTINRAKYPNRFNRLQKEIDLRTEAGEVESDPIVNTLAAVDVPISLALRAAWCFSWRLTVAVGLYYFLVIKIVVGVWLMIWPNSTQLLSAVLVILTLCYSLIVATLFMMQALAKRYQGYRIRVVRLL